MDLRVEKHLDDRLIKFDSNFFVDVQGKLKSIHGLVK